jgi:iron-sulfur cluster repair protein YtfE (RIC family)
MTSLTTPLQNHHKHCDDLFADAEAAAQKRQWPVCDDLLARFRTELEAHFATEEEVLFPAFEATTGMTGGPTQVMRFEHGQMRELLAQLSAAAQSRDEVGFAGVAETLLVLLQQHNMKEENILYPMCDRSLGDETTQIGGRLREHLEAACHA